MERAETLKEDVAGKGVEPWSAEKCDDFDSRWLKEREGVGVERGEVGVWFEGWEGDQPGRRPSGSDYPASESGQSGEPRRLPPPWP